MAKKFDHPPFHEPLLKDGILGRQWSFWFSRISDLLLEARQQNWESTSVTASATLNNTHNRVYVDATSADVTITLPSAATFTDWEYNIKKIDSSVNLVTVSSTDTIDGSTTAVLSNQYDSITVHSDGSVWWII